MNNFRKIRSDLQVSCVELAKLLGVCPSAIYNWEAGLRNPKLHTCYRLIDLAKTHGKVIRLEDILGRGD